MTAPPGEYRSWGGLVARGSEIVGAADWIAHRAGHRGPVLAYCRSGTRSTTLWALSQAGALPADEIISSAARAGYDMSHLAGHLSK